MSNQVLRILQPIFALSVLFGCSTFYIYNNSFKNIPWIYPLCFILCTVTHKALRFQNNIELIIKKVPTTTILKALMGFSFTTTVWSVAMFQRNKRISLVKKISEIVRSYQKYFGNELDYVKLKKKVILTVFLRFCIYIIMAITTVVWIFLNQIKRGITLGFIAHIGTNFVICTEIITILQIIHKLIETIKLETKKLSTSPLDISLLNKKIKSSNNTVMVIKKTCQLHHELVKVVRLFNTNYGLIMVVSFMLLFGFVTTGVCDFFHFEGDDFLRSSSNLCTGFSLTVDGVLICHYCQLIKDEVNKIGVLIHKLNTDDVELREEIEIFSVQISNEKVVFNASGFFSIDYGLLFSVFSGITTYIIILIQLSNQ